MFKNSEISLKPSSSKAESTIFNVSNVSQNVRRPPPPSKLLVITISSNWNPLSPCISHFPPALVDVLWTLLPSHSFKLRKTLSCMHACVSMCVKERIVSSSRLYTSKRLKSSNLKDSKKSIENGWIDQQTD